MRVEGLWTSEIYGPQGWENIGVIVLEGGRAMGGSRNHFSVGGYELSEDDISLSIKLEYHGPPRTLFGSSDRHLAMCIDGHHREGIIEGSVYRENAPRQTLSFRLTKRADIP